jgi:hypothetical protein
MLNVWTHRCTHTHTHTHTHTYAYMYTQWNTHAYMHTHTVLSTGVLSVCRSVHRSTHTLHVTYNNPPLCLYTLAWDVTLVNYRRVVDYTHSLAMAHAVWTWSSQYTATWTESVYNTTKWDKKTNHCFGKYLTLLPTDLSRALCSFRCLNHILPIDDSIWSQFKLAKFWKLIQFLSLF